MANRYAVANGNWSNTATWDGGTLPGVGDVVRPSNHTVTIDQDVTVGSLRTDSSAPATAGGLFLVSGNRTLNADVVVYIDANPFMRVDVGATLTINGDVSTSATGSGSSPNGIVVNGGTVTINGDMQPGTGTGNRCMTIDSGTVTVNGTVHGSSGNDGAYCIRQESGSLTINGDILCPTPVGDAANAAVYSVHGALTWTGGIAQGDGWRSAIQKVGTGPADLNGTFATPVSGLSTPFTWSVASVNVAPFSCKLRIGGTSEIGGLQFVPGPEVAINTAVGFIQEYRSDANWPTSVFDQIPKYLYDRPDTGELPGPADVREGVTFNTGLADTGTLVVPDPAHVRYGIETDDTVGTGVVVAEDVWAVDVDELTTGIGARVRNVSTVETTGEQIAASLDDTA